LNKTVWNVALLADGSAMVFVGFVIHNALLTGLGVVAMFAAVILYVRRTEKDWVEGTAERPQQPL
jgi:hypothetical protein